MCKTLLSIAAALALSAPIAAHAQFYAGGGLGLGHVSVDCSGVDSCDKNAFGFKAYGGYRFENGWATEISYFDWGQVKASGSLAAVGVPGTTLSGKLSAQGLGIGLAYFLPLPGEWVGLFRFGGVQNRSKFDVTDGTVSVGESKGAFFAYGGVGLAYRLTPQLSVTAEADFSRTKWGIDGEYEADNVQLYTVGLSYSF